MRARVPGTLRVPFVRHALAAVAESRVLPDDVAPFQSRRWRMIDWQFDSDPVPYRLLICAMIAIRSSRPAAIACLLALTFAGALASQVSAVSPAEVLLQGEASQKNARRPALDEDRRLPDDRAAMV